MDDSEGLSSNVPSGAQRLVLNDGRSVTVRPITGEGAPALREAIAHADPETLRMRFLGGRPPSDEAVIRHLVEVDYASRLAFVACDDEGNGVAIGRYEGKPGSESAEVALTVAPEWRRVGPASRLLVLLAEAVLQHGIHRFTASYLADNREVAGLVARRGLPRTTSTTVGVVDVEIDLDPSVVDIAHDEFLRP